MMNMRPILFRGNTAPWTGKKWVLRVLSSLVCGILVMVLGNIIIDPYGILRSDFSLQVQEPNTHFIKIKYLLKNRGRFDSFLFGSSRVGGIDVKKIPNGRFYNMTYSEGLPEEHLRNLRYMLEQGVKVRSVMVGLDDFSYRVDPRSHDFDLLRQQHPAVSGKSWITFYSEYFVRFGRFIPSLRDYIRQNVLHRPNRSGMIIIQDVFDSGRALCLNCDEMIDRDPDAHRAADKFSKPFHYDGDHLDVALQSIRGLVVLADEWGFRLTLFINPIHRTTYLDTDLPLMFRFKKELAQISDYYDFSGLNTVTTDNYYYHETSHFRERVGDMMLNRMTGLPKVFVPKDFGALVTKQNVDEHLGRLMRQLPAQATAADRQRQRTVPE